MVQEKQALAEKIRNYKAEKASSTVRPGQQQQQQPEEQARCQRQQQLVEDEAVCCDGL